MSTKLVVSFDGLELTNLVQIVSSRNIDEVVLVNTANNFNSFTATQRSAITTVRSSLPQSTSLTLALANENSIDIDSELYDFLRSTNLSFYNDPGLQSFSNSFVLESESVVNNEIVGENLSTFDTQNIFNNSLYQEDGPLILGNNFGIKPTLKLTNPGFVDDLNGSVKVNISAASFANILSKNTPEPDSDQSLNISEFNNLIVESDNGGPTTQPNRGKNFF